MKLNPRIIIICDYSPRVSVKNSHAIHFIIRNFTVCNFDVLTVCNKKCYEISDNLFPLAESAISASDIAFATLKKPVKIILFPFFNFHSREHSKYIKCLFAARTHNIRIDVIDLFQDKSSDPVAARDSVYNFKFLSEGTCGIFVDSFAGLFKVLVVGKQNNFSHDFQMKCYCCQKSISIGYCCPICLSVYCSTTPICKNCKIRFKIVQQ